MRSRASAAEVEQRVSQLQQWIVDSRDEVPFSVAISYAITRFGIGRRKAIRYWVAARNGLMSDMQRYRRTFGKPMLRGRDGRFASRPLELPPPASIDN